MKGCLNDPSTKVSEHDYIAIQQFRHELALSFRLEREGHTPKCATFQVFDGQVCSCGKETAP